MLNLLFGFALRHDAVARNPVEGTSQLRRAKATPQALTLEQIAAIRDAAAAWRSEPGLPGPKPDGQVRDIIEVLLGTAMRPGEVLALRPCDIEDLPDRDDRAASTAPSSSARAKVPIRQARPKTDASIRRIPVPEFAAAVLRRRIAGGVRERSGRSSPTAAAGRSAPTTCAVPSVSSWRSPGSEDTGISLRWYRRTGATVIARGSGSDAAAAFLGHTSTAITEGHYIEPDHTVDLTPAAHLERTLRPRRADGSLVEVGAARGEDAVLAAVDGEPDDDAVA